MSYTVVVDEVTYELVKSGKAQADQVIAFTQWLSKYALPIFQKFSNPKADLGELSYLDLFSLILNDLNSEALVSLFAVLVGCSQKVAEKHFDIGILVDAASIVWENQPGLQRLVNRFFSTPA